MQQNATTTTLTLRQQRAAALVAADELTDAEIAARVGLKDRTQVWRWRQRADFRAHVEALRAAFREQALKDGLADKRQRIHALDRAARRVERHLLDNDFSVTRTITLRHGARAEYQECDVERMGEFRAFLRDIAEEMGERPPSGRRRGRR